MTRARADAYTLDELLEVVVGVFLERGYDATSMEDIARATGRTKSSIYHHVSGKEQLLQLGVSRALDALFAVLHEPASVDGRAVERLEHVVRRSTGVLVEQLPYVTLLLRVRGNTEVERAALSRRREFDHQLAAVVQAAVDEGDVRDDLDPHVVTRLVFGMVNSLVEWVDPDRPVAVADAVVAVALDGLLTHAFSRKPPGFPGP